MNSADKIPHTWHPRFRSHESGCPLCGRPLKDGQKRRFIHVVDGGASILAADVPGEHGAGDMGWFEVGASCARKLGPAWSKELPPIGGE